MRTSALILLLTASLCMGCSGQASRAAPSSPSVMSATPTTSVIESVEPWTFQGAPGQIVRTAHYRIFTTERDPAYSGRLPDFLEIALTHYRTSITSLPPPKLRLDTYLMDTRTQWVRITQQLLGADGERFSHIQRGGFATRGVGVYFDIGVFDTMAVAAHEGWHQYAQRTFRETLPVWLEEGLGTYMEGHKWDGDEPIFLPWANIERFDQLRAAAANGTLLSLEELLSTTPQEIPPSSTDRLVTWYAQVWSLAHFLFEGEHHRYRPALRAMMRDAAEGRYRRTLLVRLGRAAGLHAISTGRGVGPLEAYLDAKISEVSLEYDLFVRLVVASGSRDRIVAGRTPLPEPGP